MNRSIILGLGLMLGALLQVRAQPNNTLYFMDGVPQANRINPARHTDCGFYIGIPLLSPFSSQLSSSSLAWDDVIFPNPSGDSLITFLHPQGDQQAFLDQLKPLNYVISGLGSSLISFGFNTEIGFFSMDLTSRVDGNLYFPGDLARLLLEGADDGETYTMDGMGADLSGFEEISLGWSGTINNKIQIGIRGKALFGFGNLSTNSSEFSLSTSEDMWSFRSDMDFVASLPFAEVNYDDDGMIAEIIIDQRLKDMNPWAIASQAFNAKNFGLGLDVGIDYRPNHQWLLSASILDIGYIRWTDEIHEVSYKNTYDFSSVEVNPFDISDDQGGTGYFDSIFSELADTLAGALEIGPGEAYSRRLNTKLFIGASWYLTPKINFGLLSRTDFLKETIVEQLTASANFAAGRFLNFSLSYSYINSYFKNLGAGVSFNAGPVNLYVISDNALNVVFWPEEAQSANIWVGMNLVFGYKKFAREDFDRPLVY